MAVVLSDPPLRRDKIRGVLGMPTRHHLRRFFTLGFSVITREFKSRLASIPSRLWIRIGFFPILARRAGIPGVAGGLGVPAKSINFWNREVKKNLGLFFTFWGCFSWREFPCFHADLPGFGFFFVCVRPRVFFRPHGRKKNWGLF